MAANSKIEWTEATWNPITGCSVVSPGCTNCYAMDLAGTRLKNHPSRQGLTHVVNNNHVWTGDVRMNWEWLFQPLRWSKPRKIFVCAHGDLFHENVHDHWIDLVFAVMALCPHHTFQVLTKRSVRMLNYMTRKAGDGKMDPQNHIAWDVVPEVIKRAGIECISEPILGKWRSRAIQAGTAWPLPNVIMMVSIENQDTANQRVYDLLNTPAAIRGISAEPLLGKVDLTQIEPAGIDGVINAVSPHTWEQLIEDWRDTDADWREQFLDWYNLIEMPSGKIYDPINWVIAGGESGKKARPCHPDWIRSLRDQCAKAGTAFFFKQWGEWLPGTQYAQIHCDADPDPEQSRFRCMDWDGDSYTENGGAWYDEPGEYAVYRIGKKLAGRMLDGVIHDGYPEVVRS